MVGCVFSFGGKSGTVVPSTVNSNYRLPSASLNEQLDECSCRHDIFLHHDLENTKYSFVISYSVGYIIDYRKSAPYINGHSFDADVFATIVDGEGRFLCENTHPKASFPPGVSIFLSTSLTRLYVILLQRVTGDR